ncbi:hypothetical protein ABI_32640 [Asticcacaulis biprosthecium C19]|uniref:Tetratricopeptide repeat family protein n=1 Tax=Asticcacaulis biprosthecium C19 TaxID=715226 RepID=F4QPW1_9CAUL|nr:hypothetical protein [Asticcacaulis biprosthecium]EGF90248.1 hypothetical protein ABI_32640 [Asticcacaulis biprosthecium C19]
MHYLKSVTLLGLVMAMVLAGPAVAKGQPNWLREATPAQRGQAEMSIRDIAFRNGLGDDAIIALVTMVDAPAGTSPQDRIAGASGLIDHARHIRNMLHSQISGFSYKQDKAVVAGLGKVLKAFNQGRFDKAVAYLDDLVPVDGRPTIVPDPEWRFLIQIRMSIATLIGDYDTAISGLQAARRVRADADRPLRYYLASLEAGTWYNKGRTDRTALLKSIQLYTDEVLPLAPRDTAPQDWAATQMALCIGGRVLGKSEDGTESLDHAIVACDRALEVVKREGQLFVWGELQANLAEAWEARMQRQIDPVARKQDAAKALEHFRLAHQAFGPEKHRRDGYVVDRIDALEDWQNANP